MTVFGESQATVVDLPDPILLPGDHLLHRGGSRVPRWIRFFETDDEERARNEKTEMNHASKVAKGGYPREATIIEANAGGVREIPFLAGTAGTVEVWRHDRVADDPSLQNELVVVARRHLGTGYPYAKLLLHAFDWVATKAKHKEVTFFRRLGGMISKRGVCSVRVARDDREVGLEDFGFDNPELVQPDDIHDWVRTHRPPWRRVARYENGKRVA